MERSGWIILAFLCCIGFFSCPCSAQQVLSWDLMRKFFMYSMSAYCSAEYGLSNWTCSWCEFVPIPPLNNITIFETPGAGMGKIYGYIGISNESIVVAFRGSSTTSNWILDFEFTHRDYPPIPNAFVHAGFYAGYKQVENVIKNTVKGLLLENPDTPVVCTGHSLGAALALLTANGLVQAGVDNVHVVDFGQPRVGNAVFAKYSQSVLRNIYRTVNQADIVPHLPPEDIGYHHVATEIWFPTNYTTYVVCDGSGEDPNCSDSVPKHDLTIKDHLTYLGYGFAGLAPTGPC